MLSNDQKDALCSLRNDPNIIITRPDKGNGIVILNRCDYVNKIYDILNDVSKFLLSNHDTSLANLTKFQPSIYYLKTKKALSDEIYSRIHPTSTTTPSLHGLPKLHKPGVPLRPILSCCSFFNHKCARWLSQSLVNLRQHPTNTPDTFHFLTKLSSQNIKNHTMVSFDVKSLFTYSNLVHHTTHIRQHLQKRLQRMEWPQQKLIKKTINVVYSKYHFPI